jgi:hypothetical protein
MKNTSTNSSPDRDQLIPWLLEGDVSIQYQVHRDLLDENREYLQQQMLTTGWASQILGARRPDGHWGISFYRPKWTSTHYTLLELKNLNIPQENKDIKELLIRILKEERGSDGGVHPVEYGSKSDVCINGMFLNYASYFLAPQEVLKEVVDYILLQQMEDGGFNCRKTRSGAVHSSLHSTTSVAEGIREYHLQGYTYRLEELLDAETACIRFILLHRLYLSDHTGEIIHPAFLRFAWPCRWKYDILRALDYLRLADISMDDRLKPALKVIAGKRRKDGTWTCVRHPGDCHLVMESGRQPSRWNTLRALRVYKHYRIECL